MPGWLAESALGLLENSDLDASHVDKVLENERLVASVRIWMGWHNMEELAFD